MNDKILITGATGMLGSSLSNIFPAADMLNGKQDLDLTNIQETNKWFVDKYYDVIIHCAAFTNLKYCQENREKCKILHAYINDLLSKHCKKLVYISTIPVWKKSIYKKNVYFETKKVGENIALLDEDNLVIRTNIYGSSNLAEWAFTSLKNGKQINGYENSFFNPVHVDQLSECIKELLDNKISGVYTIASDRTISKYQFLTELAKILGLDQQLINPVEIEYQDLVLENPDKTVSFLEGMEIIKNDYKDR